MHKDTDIVEIYYQIDNFFKDLDVFFIEHLDWARFVTGSKLCSKQKKPIFLFS